MISYPYFNSKILADGNKYNLLDPVERLKYFHAKLGSKIDEVKEFLDTGSFVGYLLAKKQAGKGTYSKMIEEILGPERFAHISVGDVIRKYHKILAEDSAEKEAFLAFVKKNYRGFLTAERVVDSILSRSTEKVSIPTDVVLLLLKKELQELGRKGVFIDGMPRTEDQISFSLYFRELINYQDGPDFFVLIDTPLEIIEARLVNRVICPTCGTSKNKLINYSKFVNYDETSGEFYMLCDNSYCEGFGHTRLVQKEGDALGIEAIRSRLEQDGKLMEMSSSLQGIPIIKVGSTIPKSISEDYLEAYELQPTFTYTYENNAVSMHEHPWVLRDDQGVEVHTMYAATIVLNFFSQLHKTLLG